jgi:hypothetical protein
VEREIVAEEKDGCPWWEDEGCVDLFGWELLVGDAKKYFEK